MDKAQMEALVRDYIQHLHDQCHGGFYDHIYSHFIDCDPQAKTLTLGYDMTEWGRNNSFIIHGGLIATVFDQCMGILAIWADGGRVGRTIDMNVNYIRPVPLDCRLLVQASCTTCGRTLGRFTARAYLESDPERTLATASGTYYVQGGEKTLELEKN